MKNKRILIILIIIAIILAISLSSVSAASKTITNTTSGGLKTAIAQVGNNGDVFMENGVYTGSSNTRININNNVTIEGKGSNVVIDGQGTNWIFSINRTATVSLKNIKFVNGNTGSNTGPIYTNGDLKVINCDFTNNNGVRGGAIYVSSFSNLYVEGCNFTGNYATEFGGAIYIPMGNLNVINSNFINNKAIRSDTIYSNDFKKISFDSLSFIDEYIFTLNIPSHIYYQKITTISAIVKTKYNNRPVNNVDVIFAITNLMYGNVVLTQTVKTDSNGVATLKYNVAKLGVMKINAGYLNLYSASETVDSLVSSYKLDKIIKKNGKYYKRYAKSYNNIHPTEYKNVLVKKGNILKKTNPKYWKTIESNGKVYKYYKYKKTTALSSTKIQTKIITTKKIVAYYKTYKMPSFGANKIKVAKFKGYTIVYGRWGYEWGISDLSNAVDKVKAKGAKVRYRDYNYWRFSKKPSSFTIYV